MKKDNIPKIQNNHLFPKMFSKNVFGIIENVPTNFYY